MVSLALPKGSSLEQRTIDLFAAAGLPIRRSSGADYRGSIDYRSIRVAFYKPREIPLVVQSGHFDMGLTGADWIEETGAKVDRVVTLNYAKKHDLPWRLVLAVPVDHPARCGADLPDGVRVATEYPNIGRAYFRAGGRRAEMVPSYGATEAKIPELADAVIDVVETGSALRANRLRIVEVIRTCSPVLIANPEAFRDADVRATVEGVARQLASVQAPARVLLTIRVPAGSARAVSDLLPEAGWLVGTDLRDQDLRVVQGFVPQQTVAEWIDRLLAAGAVDVTESPVSRCVPSGGEFRA